MHNRHAGDFRSATALCGNHRRGRARLGRNWRNRARLLRALLLGWNRSRRLLRGLIHNNYLPNVGVTADVTPIIVIDTTANSYTKISKSREIRAIDRLASQVSLE